MQQVIICRMQSVLIRAALEYAARGWAVHPLRARGKTPASAHAHQDATGDVDQLRRWWRSNPDFNIGIATGKPSGFFALDVDGPTGEASLAELEASHEPLPGTYSVRTGREEGGRQLYYLMPRLNPGWWLPKNEGLLGPKLDVRGDAGYVVAPPSVHPSGRTYSVLSDVPLATAPRWLLLLLVARRPNPELARMPVREPAPGELNPMQLAALRTAPGNIAAAKLAQRGNIQLNAEAYGLARCRIPREVAEPLLKNAALAAGLKPSEIRKTFESGWKSGLRAPAKTPRFAHRSGGAHS